VGLRREYAVLVHVDPESGACSIYRVDLRRAQYGANLAAEVREWRRERHFLLPYVAPGVLPAEQWRAAERAEDVRHLAVVPSKPPAVTGEPDSPWLEPVDPAIEQAVTVFGAPDLGTHAVSGGLADPGNEHLVNSTTATLGAALTRTIEQPIRDVLLIDGQPPTLDALLKFNKTELQRILRGLDSGASVAHQRKILAEKILTLLAGGKVATSTPKLSQQSQDRRPDKDPAELPAGSISVGLDPTDPRSPAFHRARLAEVDAASSAGELGRIHAYVTRVGGDQAWTDGLTEAARARLAVLDPPDRRIEWRGERVEPAAAVAAATSSQDMAQVWNLVTVGGSDEASWTAELNEAAHARLAAIQAAAEQKPPSTPFGSTT
jgi:hypothetical protein